LRLAQVPLAELESFLKWLRDKDAEEPLRGTMLETLQSIESYTTQLKALPSS
jgi:hypothetical protein